MLSSALMISQLVVPVGALHVGLQVLAEPSKTGRLVFTRVACGAGRDVVMPEIWQILVAHARNQLGQLAPARLACIHRVMHNHST